MLFSQYLNERKYKKPRSDTIESDQFAIDIIKTKCSKVLKLYQENRKTRIFRGSFTNAIVYLVSPQSSKRMSGNTTNFYTMLFDNLPSWSNYPKRGHGVICSNNFWTASGYGSTCYLAFPYDQAVIGVCPSEDIWDAFMGKSIKRTLDGFNYDLRDLFKMSFDIKSEASLLKTLDIMQKKMSISKEMLKVFNYLFISDKYKYDGKEPLIKFFDTAFNPDAAGFQYFLNISNFKLKKEHEVWFDVPAVMIDMKRGLSLLEELSVGF